MINTYVSVLADHCAAHAIAFAITFTVAFAISFGFALSFAIALTVVSHRESMNIRICAFFYLLVVIACHWPRIL